MKTNSENKTNNITDFTSRTNKVSLIDVIKYAKKHYFITLINFILINTKENSKREPTM